MNLKRLNLSFIIQNISRVFYKNINDTIEYRQLVFFFSIEI